MPRVEDAFSEWGGCHGNPHCIRQHEEFWFGAAQFDSVPSNDHRTFSMLQQPHRIFHGRGIGCGPVPVRSWPMIVWLRHAFFDELYKHVEGNVDIHRSWPAVGHQCERLTESEGKHVGPGRLKAALDVRTEGVDEVSLEVFPRLLKRTPIPLPSRNVTRNVEHR